jgi:hypothetical protein
VLKVQESWREQDIVLNDNAPTEVYFKDTEPNHIVIANPTTNPMYISESANVSPSFHEMSIPSGGFKMFAKPKGMKRINIWHADAGEDKIHIVSFNDDFNPQSISQTQETVNTQQITGSVDIATMPAIPSGNNNIGKVDVNSLPSLPAGNNSIGQVAVNSLPALPAGNNNLGKVDINSIPNIDQLGYSYQQVNGTAGDNVVKPTSGKIAGVVGIGSINLILKDGTNQVWNTIPGGTDKFFPFPIQCNTSIILNFDVAGTAYILYK